jgi:hypothetical protein
MEPYPNHYSRRPRANESVAATVVESSVRVFLDELQKMESRLDDRIKDHCSELERRVAETEERLISLEMARAES